MKRTATALTLILAILISTLLTISVHPVKASADFWVKRSPMPNGECRLGAVSVNGRIYTIGYNFSYMFDPSTDRWVPKMQMPSHRHDFAIAACQNKIYVIGGWNSTNPNTGISITVGTNEMYDPATDQWTTKAPMPVKAADLQANMVDGKIYVISGISDISTPTLSSSNCVYDPSSNSWSMAAPIPTPVFYYASAVIDNKIYIEGGEVSSLPHHSSLNQIYDTKTNTWIQGKTLPVSVEQGAAGATTGVLASAKLYIIGGTNDGYSGINTSQIYDPQTDNWTLGAQMPTARKSLAVAVVNDAFYAFGGVSSVGFGDMGTVYAVNEQYIPLDYQGSIPSQYVPTPSPYVTSTPTPTSSPIATLTPSKTPSASPTASPQPTHSPEPFPTLPVVAFSVVVVPVVVASLLIYFKKRRRGLVAV